MKGDLTVIEGIDVSSDGVGAALAASVLKGVTIDYLIHNAGSFGNSREVSGFDAISNEQMMGTVSMDRMRAAFELNTLGPLRVQQALNGQIRSPGGKVGVISTGVASIGDNSSGGMYAYRTSKAGVNMLSKSFSCDLKAKEIAVVAIAPGFVNTELSGQDMSKGMPVTLCANRLLEIMDGLTMEGTGTFMSVPTSGDPPKLFPGGW